MQRLGHFIVRRRVVLLVLTAAGVVVAAVFGGGVAEHLSSGGFDNDSFESSRTEDVLTEEFGSGTPNFLLLVTARDGNVDDAAVRERGLALARELDADQQIGEVVSYWDQNASPLRSTDGDQALVVADVLGSHDDVDDWVSEHAERFTIEDDVVVVGVGGSAQVFTEVGEIIEQDLLRAELIAIPLTLILLLFVFRGLVAAALPLGVGLVAIIGTFLILRLVAGFTEVSIFSLNMTTAMGLGLAIDYSLFIVSRFREELAAGRSADAAVVRTVETAGRTILFSAVTVAISLAALLVFPLPFLRSFGYAGIAVALVAASAAILSLPALLAVLGPNVNRLAVLRRPPKPPSEGVWHRVATVVMRRPLPVATLVILFLLFLGSPFLRLELGLPDDRVLPEDAASRQVSDDIRENFDSNEAGAIQVVAEDVGHPLARAGEIDAYASELSTLDGVARVDARTGIYQDGEAVLSFFDGATLTDGGGLGDRFRAESATWWSVVPDLEPVSPEGEALVHEVRDLDAPFDVLVGGEGARLVDSKAALFDSLPLALILIASAMFVLLFLAFGSVVVPLKALVLNVLSLTASFGAMVWIFQDGHLSGLLGFTATGTLTSTIPILMFCVAFGLSMDYEVFLLSRIKEEYDASGDNTAAVALGLERTGRIITAAALLISIVFFAFATARVSFMILFGLGLAIAVLMDAFVVRGTLVPAFMRMAGRWNWWAPAWMQRIYDRFGISEAGPETPAVDLTPDLELPLGSDGIGEKAGSR